MCTAADGKEAINVLRTIPVDILLTDLDMPIMDGYELLIHRKKPSRMKALVMTGSGGPEVQMKLQPLGISRFIKKPFGIFEVLDRVMQELGDAAAL